MGRLRPVRGVRRVLVTGSSGLLGRSLTRQLAAAGHKVTLFSRSNGDDILDLPALERAAKGQDCLVHLAGLASGARDVLLRANVEGTRNACQAAFRAPCSLVLASSAGAYEPVTDYGLSKRMAEDVVRQYAAQGLQSCVLRIFNVYGEGAGQSVVTRFLADDPIVLHGDGGATRDFIHVDDVASAITACLDPEGLVESDVGTGRGTTLAQLAALVGKPVVHRPEPGPMIRSSVARNVTVPGWVPRVDLATWVRQASHRTSGDPERAL